MNVLSGKLVAGALLFGLATGASAQTLGPATAEAKARLACGTGTVVSAQYLPGNLLQVTCSQNAPTDAIPTQLQGTALTTPAVVGLLAVVTVLVIATGGTDTGTTTTTTSSPGE